MTGSANSPTRTSDAAASPAFPDLIASIEDYLRVTNVNPKLLIWTVSAESILEKVRRRRVALNQATKTETYH
jgi:hypothetical protein